MSPHRPADLGATALNPLERRTAASLATVHASRLLGLFMVLPVLSLAASDFSGATPLLVGIAIGAYGLTQGLLQIPMGMLSDRIGRKPVILGGLMVFALGSLVAALADDMTGIIIGRLLQGAGAVSAAVMALAADLTREEVRLRVMAIMGATIGVAFALSMILGPLLNAWVGLSGIFWLTAVLALLGIATVLLVTPSAPRPTFHRDSEASPRMLPNVLRRVELLRIDAGIFTLHLVLTSTFVVVPLALRDLAGVPVERHWAVYLPVLLASLLLMVPFIILAERRRRLKPVFLGSIAALAAALFALAALHETLPALLALLIVYFTAVNLLEASLPSLVAKTAPLDLKGTAMGAYSSSQFFGAFAGGVLGGLLFGSAGYVGLFATCGILTLVWLGIAAGMRNPDHVSTHLLKLDRVDAEAASHLAGRLRAQPGVSEALVSVDEGVAYLKIDRRRVDFDALREVAIGNA